MMDVVMRRFLLHSEIVPSILLDKCVHVERVTIEQRTGEQHQWAPCYCCCVTWPIYCLYRCKVSRRHV